MIQFMKDVFFGFKSSKISKKILIFTLILIYILIMFLVSFKVNYEIITPGGVNYTVETNEKKHSGASILIETNNDPGFVYTVGVYSHRSISLFQYFVGKLNKDIDYLSYDPKTIPTLEEEYQMGVKQKELSIINALIVAYTEAKKIDSNINLDYEFTGILVNYVSKDSKSGLLADDIITHINGVKVESESHFKELINLISNEEYFKIKVIRGKETREINSKKIFNEQNNKYILGINTSEYYSIDEKTAHPKFKLNSQPRSIGGSGGAMLTLSIYNALIKEDITKGKIIMGTGTIDVNGIVGDIGAVEQKVITAKLLGANYFFVNQEDYEAAKAKAFDIKAEFPVVKVTNFSDMIDYLKGL